MYQSIGHHPKSTYMTTDGYALHNDSGLDLIIDIAGVYFPLLTLTYTMTHTVEPQHQTGMHGPVALINTDHDGSGTFSYASFLVKGEDAPTTEKTLALPDLLQEKYDEGQSKYFDIYILEVQGPRTPMDSRMSFEDQVETILQNQSSVGFIEALADCKITKQHRNVQHKQSVISSWDFDYSYKIPP